jgi:hypothetical protein
VGFVKLLRIPFSLSIESVEDSDMDLFFAKVSKALGPADGGVLSPPTELRRADGSDIRLGEVYEFRRDLGAASISSMDSPDSFWKSPSCESFQVVDLPVLTSSITMSVGDGWRAWAATAASSMAAAAAAAAAGGARLESRLSRRTLPRFDGYDADDDGVIVIAAAVTE